MAHKKESKKILKDFEPAFQLGGASAVTSLLGAEFEKNLPAEAGTPLSDIGQTTGRFVAPASALGGFATIQRQLKDIDKQLKKEDKKKMKGGNS